MNRPDIVLYKRLRHAELYIYLIFSQ